MKVKIEKLKCKHCGFEWYPRKPEVVQCPHCKTAHWDKERIYKIRKNRTKNSKSIEEKVNE